MRIDGDMAEVFGDKVDYLSWRYKSHGEWLAGRDKSPYAGKPTIGSSDAPIVMGQSSFKDARTLWLEKHGDIPREFKGNADTQRGTLAEAHIRELFAIERGDTWEVLDGTGVVFYSKHYPWMSAALDAILRERASGEMGILEIKDCRWSPKWRYGMPTMYLTQVLHQLCVTGFSFAILHARLVGTESVTERDYLVRVGDFPIEIGEMLAKERGFMQALADGIPPAYEIPLR